MANKRQAYKEQWDAEHTWRFTVKYNKNTDADIIEAIQSAPNKFGFVKAAIRYYIASGCPAPQKKSAK